MRTRDPGWKKLGAGIKIDPGSGMEKSRIRDNHPGSATLSSLNYFTGYETIKIYILLTFPNPNQLYATNSNET
jgi:hypothetical protein